MTVLVNYYTCSYGDSFVNMFNGQPVERVNSIAKCSFYKFIEPIFYNVDYMHRQQDWKLCQGLQLAAVPCHRQNSFDFDKAFNQPMKVISIIVDRDDFLGDRFKSIHMDGRNKSILNSKLKTILNRYPSKYKEIINLDYKNWANANCFDTDIKFNFSWIFDLSQVENFCIENNVTFNKDWILDVRQDLQKYVVL